MKKEVILEFIKETEDESTRKVEVGAAKDIIGEEDHQVQVMIAESDLTQELYHNLDRKSHY